MPLTDITVVAGSIFFVIGLVLIVKNFVITRQRISNIVSSEIERLKKELSDARQNFQKKEQEIEKELSKKHDVIKSAEEKNNMLSAQLDDAKNELSNKASIVSALTGEMDNLKTVLRKLEEKGQE